MKATIRLLNSYYLKGFFGPFFVVIFPILLLFIMSNAMNSMAIASGHASEFMRNMIAGIMITALISNGLFGIPIMIIEFKKSTLIKRIGSANVSKKTFLISILLYQLVWSIFSVFWILLWGGIIIGTKSQYTWGIAFNINTLNSIPMIFLTLLVSIGIGLLIVSLVNSQQGVMGITNVIYLPISFLSGSFINKQNIDSSGALNGISYCMPTKYAVDPFFAVFNNGFSGLDAMGWKAYGFPIIAIIFFLLMIAVTIKKFNWGK